MAQNSKTNRVVPRYFTNSMEQLQEGYVSTVAATAGVTVHTVTRDLHKYDMELVRQPSISVEEVAVKMQLKATTDFKIDLVSNTFDYRFRSRQAYESLAMQRSTIKHILIVMLVHPDQTRWNFVHHRAMLTRHACYWMNLEGIQAPAAPELPVVSVPLANIFNSSALTGILDRIESGGRP